MRPHNQGSHLAQIPDCSLVPTCIKGSTFAIHGFVRSDMSRIKNETLSIRTSMEIKRLLRLAAEREHRSVASMIEVLVLAYAKENHLDDSKLDHSNLTPEQS